MAKCQNCGAPLEGNKCDYCGHVFVTTNNVGSMNDGNPDNTVVMTRVTTTTTNITSDMMGAAVPKRAVTERSNKSFIVLCVLWLFLGYFGGHRFYAGKVGTGFLYLFTFGLFGVGFIVDLFLIASKNFTDANGRYIVNN